MKKVFKDFRDFITRGNVIDLAIGIIIGSAFSTVVSSIVENIMMPPFGLILGESDFQNHFLVLKSSEPLQSDATLQMAKEAGAVTLNYGQFISDLIGFLILGIGVFLIVKGVQSLERKVTELKDDKSKDEMSKEKDKEKECPYCFKVIDIKAKRCPFCTSQLNITDESDHE